MFDNTCVATIRSQLRVQPAKSMNHLAQLSFASVILVTLIVGGYLWDRYHNRRADVDSSQQNKRFDDL